MSLRVAYFTVDDQRMRAVRRIRDIVFCGEQNVPPELEWDAFEADCEYALAEKDGVALGTARTRPYGPGTFKVERVAVLSQARGQGIGHDLMANVMDHLVARGAHTIVLNAQTQVERFYTRLGFTSVGPAFIEADIPHIKMVWHRPA